MSRYLFVVLAASLAFAFSAFAHCDSVDGPVITEARAALDAGAVTPVLKWVPAFAEQQIRDAFAKTVTVRSKGPEAKQVADQWFFETLVRVHRESEGAPFTGLKGAGSTEPGIEAADKALESQALEPLEKEIVAGMAAGLRQRFAAVREARAHADRSVEEGRHYVRTYVEFIHYVERLHVASSTTAAPHEH